MNKFTQAYLDAIRSQLEEEKKNITVRISELTLQDPFSDPDRLNDNAASDMEASEESNHDRFQALLSELREKLGELDDALVRIQNGSYGVCTGCNHDIGQERLRILPAAVLCLSCEKKK